MTSLATIMGSLPIALGIGAGAEMRQPMAVAVIGGLTTSTLLTLVVVPVVYSIFDSLKKLVGFLLIIVGVLVLTGLAWMSFF
jgi:Cu/Ag efflux pump CusA